MVDPDGVAPEGDEPPIVRLLEGLDTQGERLRVAVRNVRRMWWALALVVAGMLVLGVAYKVQLDRLHEVASRNRVLSVTTATLAVSTTRSLCELRRDLEDRVRNGEAFLRAHPHGIPGIPAGTLKTSIAGQRRTVTALSDLTCGAPALRHGNP